MIEAVKKALIYVSEVFETEKLENIGLEEVVLNETQNTWEITIGFSRPWDHLRSGLMTGLQPQHSSRQYKVVTIDNDTQEVKSIKIRDL